MSSTKPACTEAWRVLDLSYDTGPLQLATTEVLLDSIGRGEAPPALRPYSWSEPVVILGVGQPAADLDLDATRRRGFRVQRRISGGTAVFHDADELSLDLIVPPGGPVAPTDVLESYAAWAHILQAALARLGVEAGCLTIPEARSHQPDPTLAPACFGSFAPYEITWEGRKLVGLSQIRRRGAVALQAAVYFRFDAEALAAALGRDAMWAARLRSRVADLDEAAGRRITAAELVDVIRAAASERLPVPLRSGALACEESARAGLLARSKYDKLAWILRR